MRLSKSYLAGLFDGEGCIFIAKRIGKRTPHYILTCSICMTHRPLIDLLCEQFERKITIHKIDLRKPHCKRAFELVLSSEKAANFLRLVHDELLVKKEEARLALIFQDHLNAHRGRLSKMARGPEFEELVAYRESLRLQVKACKKISFLGASDWNAGEFGGHPMPGPSEDTEGQYRAKQGLTTLGMCNEQVPAPKGKICSALSGNTKNVAEMTTSYRLKSVE